MAEIILNEPPLRISGVQIELSSPDFKHVKSMRSLKKLRLFDHLEEFDQDVAEKELAIILGIETEQETPAVSSSAIAEEDAVS